VVQPIAYGDDNAVTLGAMRALGEGARGIAVVRPNVKDEEPARVSPRPGFEGCGS
jgi:D-galactarolactone isomerase